jgi:hypothetical protein
MKATLFAVAIGVTALIGIPSLASAQYTQGVQTYSGANDPPPPPAYYYNNRR